MNKEQKKRIIGVAVIGSVILISVATGGTVRISRNRRKRNEEELYAQANNVSISAEATSFGAIEQDIYYPVKNENNSTLFSYKKSGGKFYASSGKGTNMEMVDGLSLVNPPTKTGSVFEGYYYTYMGTEYKIIDSKGKFVNNSTNNNFPQYLFNTVENITLTAKWTANTYYNVRDDEGDQLFVYTNDGTNIIFVGYVAGSQNVVMADGVYLVYPPTKSGSTFEGYYYTYMGTEYKIIDSNGCIVLNSTNNNFPQYLFKTIGGEITLNAKWEEAEVTGVRISSTSPKFVSGQPCKLENLEINEEAQLTASLLPEGVTSSISWTSTNTSVVEVDNNGKVKAVGSGSAQINARAENGIYMTCLVTVKAEPTGVRISSTSPKFVSGQPCKLENLEINEEAQLTASLLPEGTTSSISWTSTNTSVVEVDNNGKVKAVGSGSAQINARAENGIYMTCLVTVKATEYTFVFDANGGTGGPTTVTGNSAKGIMPTEEPTKTGYRFQGWALESNPNIQWTTSGGNYDLSILNSSDIVNNTVNFIAIWQKVDLSIENPEYSVNVGGEVTIQAKIQNAADETLNWKSSNTEIATVDTTGKVTGIKAGEATITVNDTYGNTATCKIKVTENKVDVESVTLSATASEINIGGSTQLTAKVTPDNATNKKVTYSSSDTSIATVGETTGLVTGVSEGEVTITVTTEDGSKTDTVKIKVVKQEESKEDTTKPELNLEGKWLNKAEYLIYIKATDADSGVDSVVIVNDDGTEIPVTQKDENGYYFKPSANGTYTIKVKDKSGNTETKTYKVEALLEKTTIEAAKDSEGKDIVYITPITNKNVKSVMVNGKEITDKTEDGRFYFYPNANGKYMVKVSYENANGNEIVEEIEHEETRIEENNNNGNGTGNNSGNGSNNGSGSNTGSSVNTGSASSGTSSTGGTSNSTSLSTIGSSKSSSNLPYAGSTGMGALLAAIVSSFSAAFAWIKAKFKNKK